MDCLAWPASRFGRASERRLTLAPTSAGGESERLHPAASSKRRLPRRALADYRGHAATRGIRARQTALVVARYSSGREESGAVRSDRWPSSASFSDS